MYLRVVVGIKTMKCMLTVNKMVSKMKDNNIMSVRSHSV